jgi:hypothetical protein
LPIFVDVIVGKYCILQTRVYNTLRLIDQDERNDVVMSKQKALFLGRLGDLGLGNSKGIPSSLKDATQEELQAYGRKLLSAVTTVTDPHHFTCIDGRRCRSTQHARRAQVGGTGAAIEVALNAESPLLDRQATLGHAVHVVETALGFVERSAHLGGCGGANGAIIDNQTIATKDAIMSGVHAFMSQSDVRKFAGFDYSDRTAKAICRRAVDTAAWLKQHGWDGKKYVDGVRRESPAGVEDLETFDNGFGGHEEPSLAVVLSRTRDRTVSPDVAERLGLGRPFVWNIDASLDAAIQLGMGIDDDVRAAFTANLAKHVAVADRLASDKTPVYLLVV